MITPDTQIIWEKINLFDWKITPKLNVSLKSKTSLKVGGAANIFIQISNINELVALFGILSSRAYPWFVIGNGTNLIVRDEGFPGVVIRLKGEFGMVHSDITSQKSVIAGAGSPNTRLHNFCEKQSLSGTEFLFTIPGTLGGAIHMNAGAHGSEIKNLINWVEVLDEEGKIKKLTRNMCGFSYRKSIFKKKNWVILRAGLSLQPNTIEYIQHQKKTYIQHRQNVQPTHIKTWGSVFLNPEGKSAGQMIEACGLKGKGFGGAIINTKHANFIENTGNATFKDIQNTVKMARNAVKMKYGIDLIPEGEIIPNK